MEDRLKALPPEFVQRLRDFVPQGLLESVGAGYVTDRLTTFRVNTLKATPDQVLRELEAAGLVLEAAQDLPLAYIVRGDREHKMTETRSYTEGWIYLQSLSSQIPPLVLDPQPGETILDLAAAPGGKTCQMAGLMQNRGRIIAVEPDPIRADRLQFNVQKQGAAIVEIQRLKGECLPDEWHGRFDRVLLDAPCSSEGTFCVSDPKSFAHWTPDFSKKMARVQKLLLEKAWRCVKPGGRIVYSTCALSPEENEDVLHWALMNGPKLALQSIPLKMPFLRPALKSWKSVTFDAQIAKARRIYPSETMEGFFVAALRRG